MISIRQATMNDLSILLEFEQDLINTERPMDVTLKKEKTQYYDLPNFIRNENIEIVVAEENDEVLSVGYAKVIKGKEYLQFETYSYLGFMYTKPTHRGRGINKKIMSYLYDWSLERGIYEIRLEVYPDNLGAIKAYEKAGMKASMHTMRIDLRDK